MKVGLVISQRWAHILLGVRRLCSGLSEVACARRSSRNISLAAFSPIRIRSAKHIRDTYPAIPRDGVVRGSPADCQVQQPAREKSPAGVLCPFHILCGSARGFIYSAVCRRRMRRSRVRSKKSIVFAFDSEPCIRVKGVGQPAVSFCGSHRRATRRLPSSSRTTWPPIPRAGGLRGPCSP